MMNWQTFSLLQVSLHLGNGRNHWQSIIDVEKNILRIKFWFLHLAAYGLRLIHSNSHSELHRRTWTTGGWNYNNVKRTRCVSTTDYNHIETSNTMTDEKNMKSIRRNFDAHSWKQRSSLFSKRPRICSMCMFYIDVGFIVWHIDSLLQSPPLSLSACIDARVSWYFAFTLQLTLLRGVFTFMHQNLCYKLPF